MISEGYNETPTINNFKPKYIPVRCPKCSGHGTVNYGSLVCDACSGTGVYKVPVEEGEEHGYRPK